jgi:spermidine synthase
LQILHRAISGHHEIIVYETTELYGEKGHFRVVKFGNAAVQGAMDVRQPQRVVFEYPRAMIHLMECNDPAFEDVFMIGHGIGTVAGQYPGKPIKAVELDPIVADISKRFFGYAKDVVIGDGRQVLGHEKARSYDYILVDAFDAKGTPSHLTTYEFFELTKEKLDDQGSIIMNVMGKGVHDQRIDAIHTTLQQVYTYTTTFLLPAGISGVVTEQQNMLLMGSNKPTRYQARQMAGFYEIERNPGHILLD